jgi:glycosyltransferase involved in cell wall biosynthesis
VDDASLNIFYSHAQYFLFLSEYEGFGLPVLEAMTAGTPVICSNNSSLPEVSGGAALEVDCHNANEIMSAMEKLYYDDFFRQNCIEKGLERAKEFSWDKTLNNIINIMSSTMEEYYVSS